MRACGVSGGDPEALAQLFRLDHLTTRMRRQAEGLIILSGAVPGRGWRDPVPVVDILRAAVAEVEDYVRVDVTSESDDLVAGNAVSDVIHLIAELVENAVRVAGTAPSGANQQPWRFVVLKERQHRHDLANSMMAPRNLDRCVVAIAVVLLNERLRFDAGRVAQNIMVAAWGQGVGSCPNSVRPDDHDLVRKDLGAPAEAAIATIITLGYPAPGQPRPRPKADPEKIVAKLNRLPLEELVHRERFTG